MDNRLLFTIGRGVGKEGEIGEGDRGIDCKL